MAEVEVIKARNTLASQKRGKVIERLRVAAYCRVSTDTEDQLSSYKSQVAYYTDLIRKNAEWVLADIYADEAITGTQVIKREDFQRMINDCMNGNIDMIITKSISRFARNTLDTLKYVRMLKERNIAVYFEDEKINTLTMDGELLLVVLSSVAQQEVENISSNVKKGLKMKMQRGELVGFQGCLGYDYHPEDKSITVNEKEAEIVRYIFQRYVEGAGGSVISKELENLGYKTKRGTPTWAESTVLGIIKNEKYKGDILLGKTFTVDPISKRRLENYGEEDQFYLRNHHEPIISAEIFDKAEEIRLRRSRGKNTVSKNGGKREKFSRKYTFSCMMDCAFCGGTLTRRSWHSGTKYNKTIWQCVTSTKKGKKFCPDSKGISEAAIEKAFLESYRVMCNNNKDVLDEFLQRMEDVLSSSTVHKELSKIEKEVQLLEARKNKLVDMRLEDIIDKETYEEKYADILQKIDKKVQESEKLTSNLEEEKDIKKRLLGFKKVLEQNEFIDTFDRYVFESVVEKVIVGGVDEDGNKDPAMITFVYKTGLSNSLDGNKFKPARKNAKKEKSNTSNELCSHTGNEDNKLYQHSSNDTCGVLYIIGKKIVTKQ
ncbi:recombinase family protein [Lentibacillus sp. N15]|uniref:recombinase family protein n=1 Tax=Lentibacillus songyuanensis TaxID=3136161 RepID=UPI0031BB4EC2